MLPVKVTLVDSEALLPLPAGRGTFVYALGTLKCKLHHAIKRSKV